MALKIDVHEVEEATKIRAKYLRALENEEFNLLPGSAYVRSFIRTYADYLGLDSRALLDRYRAISPNSDDETHTGSARASDTRSSTRRWFLLVVIVLIVIAVLLILGSVGGK